MPHEVRDARVNVAKDAAGYVRVIGVRVIKNSSEQVLQVDLLNTSRRLFKIDYRVVWLDSTGVEVPSLSSKWRMMSISPSDTASLGAATGPAANDFRMNIRRTDD